MSAHASERRYGLVSADFSTATRVASVIVVPAALVLAVLGTPLAEGVFGYGSTSIASARYVGEVFAVFSLGLLPYMLFQLLLRVFYAMHDSRTPALISVITMVINITANLVALAVLPPQHVVAGLGAGFGVANLVGTAIAWRVLSRRVGGLDGRRVGSALARMHAAAIPGVIFAIAVSVMVGAVIPGGRIAALLTVALGGQRRDAALRAVRQGLRRGRTRRPHRVGTRQAPLNGTPSRRRGPARRRRPGPVFRGARHLLAVTVCDGSLRGTVGGRSAA